VKPVCDHIQPFPYIDDIYIENGEDTIVTYNDIAAQEAGVRTNVGATVANTTILALRRIGSRCPARPFLGHS
jgi:hypothetical protein